MWDLLLTYIDISLLSSHSGFSWNCICLLVGMFFRCWCHGLLVPSNTYSVISKSDLEFVFELFKGERHESDMLFQAQIKDKKIIEIQTRSPVSFSHLFCCFWAFLDHPRVKPSLEHVWRKGVLLHPALLKSGLLALLNRVQNEEGLH